MRVRRTKLTDQFTLDDFRDRYGEEAVILLARVDERYIPVNDDTVLPRTGITLLSQIPGGKAADAEPARRGGAEQRG